MTKRESDRRLQTVNPEIFSMMASRNLPSVTEEMTRIILAQCSQGKTTPQEESAPLEEPSKGKKRGVPFGRVGIAALLLLVLTLGTVFAVSMSQSLSQFFSQDQMDIITQDLLYLNESVTEGNVTMAVEELLNTKRGYMVSITFQNDGPLPWKEGTYVSFVNSKVEEYDETDLSVVGIHSRGILSEDGRRLTYYLEKSCADGLSGRTLTVTAADVMREKPLQTFNLYTPLSELSGEPISFVSALETSSYIQERLGTNQAVERLYQVRSPSAGQALHQSLPHFLFDGAVVAEESPQLQEFTGIKNGLFLFFRRDSDVSPPAGVISSQITDLDIVHTENNVIMKATTVTSFLDPETQQYVTAFIFPGVTTAEEASRYAVYNISLKEEELVQEGQWHLSLKVKNEDVGKEIPFSEVLKKHEQELYVPYNGVLRISPLGITVIGETADERPLDDTLSTYHIRLKAWNSSDEEIPLTVSGGTVFSQGSGFTVSYKVLADDGGWGFLDMRQIAYITIGEHALRIDLDWQ